MNKYDSEGAHIFKINVAGLKNLFVFFIALLHLQFTKGDYKLWYNLCRYSLVCILAVDA